MSHSATNATVAATAIEGNGDGRRADTRAPSSPTVLVLIDDAALAALVCAHLHAIGLKSQVASSAASLVRELGRHRPCCLVTDAPADLRRPQELCRELALRELPVPLLVITEKTDVATAVAAVRAGVLDVIEIDTLPRRLASSVLQAIASDLGSRARRMESDAVRLRYSRLSPRERDVLRLVLEGATSSLIADRLGLREKTIEVYRSHINKKMCTRNAAELARLMSTLS